MMQPHGGRLFSIAAARGWDWRDMLDFSANINPLGPSPRVREAIEAAIGGVVHYPDSQPPGLLEALSHAWSVPPESILLGNGATELIHFLPRVIEGEATIAVPAFTEFHRVFPHARAVPVHRPETWPHQGLLIVTRPVNPTGAMPVMGDWLRNTGNPILVDESFLEFTGAASLALTRPNLFVLRSLTKFYALPGLRLGALIAAPETVGQWRALRDPWAVNTLAAAAGEAAVRDAGHGRRALALVREEREWLRRVIPQATVPASHANYLCAKLARPAARLAAFLEDRKILLRDCTGWPGVEGDTTVRVAVRTRAENERLIEAWREFA